MRLYYCQILILCSSTDCIYIYAFRIEHLFTLKQRGIEINRKGMTLRRSERTLVDQKNKNYSLNLDFVLRNCSLSLVGKVSELNLIYL